MLCRGGTIEQLQRVEVRVLRGARATREVRRGRQHQHVEQRRAKSKRLEGDDGLHMRWKAWAGGGRCSDAGATDGKGGEGRGRGRRHGAGSWPRQLSTQPLCMRERWKAAPAGAPLGCRSRQRSWRWRRRSARTGSACRSGPTSAATAPARPLSEMEEKTQLQSKDVRHGEGVHAGDSWCGG